MYIKSKNKTTKMERKPVKQKKITKSEHKRSYLKLEIICTQFPANQ